MLYDFLIIIFLIVGAGFIYKMYFKTEKEMEKEIENTNVKVNLENYKPFSTIENTGTDINKIDNNIETSYTREKTSTGFFNLI
tara:strand:+ start:567 stop:815 length:249 start_codon:yes stop_codon:yes gene_type:complete